MGLNQWKKMLLGGSDLKRMDGRLTEPIDFYPSNLSAAYIPIRRREGFKALLSLRQLTETENNPGIGMIPSQAGPISPALPMAVITR